MMKWISLLLTLLSVVRSLWARSDGAPQDACADLMPRHGVDGALSNNGFFLQSDVIDTQSYVPGETYKGK